ncbi:2Fe-2S iron-sulfur cluster-binding protein [Thermopolyspora sp. NPDC052614]|uniref:2Fe-2S iron-sulfur cluster-binding protein n=1 Tax=Thermopolyspora sp. NPDC052614 TaxID=3155682 RepID=UPI00342AAC78
MQPVRLIVNRVPHHVRVDTRATLLDTLRERLGLTGAKKGCDHGQCGTCTVLVGDRRVYACLALTVALDGAEITTVEGLAAGGEPHPLQRAFIDHGAVGCGYCAPGQLCSAVAILADVARGAPSAATADLSAPPRLDLDEVRERMSGNICRCGCYGRIAEAITEVAATPRAERPPP